MGEDQQTSHEDGEKNFNTASVAVFHKVRRLSKTQLFVLIALALVLVAMAIVTIVQLQPALKVGKYSYSKDEYKMLIAQAERIGVDEGEARTALTKGLASKEAADRLKVTYRTNASDLNEAARYEYKLGQDSKGSDYQRETAVYRVVEANVRLETKGGYKASAVYVPFARYIYGFELNSKTGENANLDLIGNETAIARDMGYAYKKVEELRTAYESKKKTAAQVIQAALDDDVSSYGKGPRPSTTLLVARDKTLETYEGNTSQYIERGQFSLIESNKDKLGKASVVMEAVVSPEDITSNSFIARGDQVAVGYYFVIVDSVVAPKAETQNNYDKLVKELQ